MEAEFWQEVWTEGRTEFHRAKVHPVLQRYATPKMLHGKRVLVPLCGKSHDLIWLRTHAAQVIGVELIETAVAQFFADNKLTYTQPAPAQYVSDNLTLLNMDFFTVDQALVGSLDLVYDRAALIALPPDLRLRYIDHLNTLLPLGAQQLVVTLEYHFQREGPPWSIAPAQVQQYYQAHYAIEQLETHITNDLRISNQSEQDTLTEHVFLLTRIR